MTTPDAAAGREARWPSLAPPRYLGQLSPTFQRAEAERRAGVRVEDCDFYHYVELADGRVVPGAWDLRGGEDVYLGRQQWAGKRVLEMGPATGHLTFWLESQGAHVVAFDLGWDARPDVMRPEGPSAMAIRERAVRDIDRVHNGWWLLHAERRSAAALVHGDIYALPGDLGRFDVSVFGSILLHLRDPYGALAEAARLTNHTMVVTDVVSDGLGEDDSLMRFDPARGRAPMGWWNLSPGAVKRMLAALGFPDATCEYHRQRYHQGDDVTAPSVEMALFTVVAHRATAAPATSPKPAAS